MYGPLVIAYLFLGGAAAGGMFVAAAWSLAFRRLPGGREHAVRHARAFAALQARAWPLCLLLLVLAISALFWDLGRPDRMMLLMMSPRVTVMTFGTLCLVVELLLGIALTLRSLFHLRVLGGRAGRVLEALCCACSLCTMAYTAFLLMSAMGMPFWSSPWLVGVFTCSSLSNGLSLLLLVDYFTKDQTILLRAVKPLQKAHLACLAAEAVTLALFLSAAFANPGARSACAALLSPDMMPIASVGVGVLGLALPAALETYSLTRKECRCIPLADVLCLFGGLCLRYCIITCGIS
ncbi:NrfD/PsrC family molybdoenzyme membrane anchor subunit [Adlercreutzia sp. ZJ473]|uniref:NrfD/PsrC family molybdoenzyme membrane anchor subunit n=1 Tax=Adlercreutzia sp. ZJ473 TaxID=2722822 RepID=UPI00155606D5|nr:NrfD/PsrC family molybdoenzyme membrane anchor subunit [Adlercreutzia sp. ZJ473]